MYGKEPIATFCNIDGYLVTEQGTTKTEKWKCRKHGYIVLVPYHSNDLVFWACPDCAVERFGGKLCEAQSASHSNSVVETCYACKETTNLEDCKLCGATSCSKHRIEGTCEDCAKFAEAGGGIPCWGCY